MYMWASQVAHGNQSACQWRRHRQPVQSLSRVRLFATLWIAAHQASLSITTPRACSNSCPSCQWCHPTISSSVIPFSSHLQSFPASGSFPISQFFTSGGQSIGVSASASFFPMNIQDWSPLGLTGWISLQFKGLSRVFSTPQFKSINSSALSLLYSPTLTSIPNWTIMEAQRRHKRGKNSLSPFLFIYLSIYVYIHTAALFNTTPFKKIIHFHQVRFIPTMKDCFNMPKLVNRIHYINKIKGKDFVIILKNAGEKHLKKI